jgi:hypothetical protein
MKQAEPKPWSHYVKVPLLSSTASGLLSLAVFPIDLVNTIVKANPIHQPARTVVRDVYRKHGLQGFYKGGTMIFYELLPSNFVYFFTYDYLNKKSVDWFDRHQLKCKWIIPIATSFLAEVSCLFIYVPMDTILTRMQSHHPAYNYRSVWDGIRSIYQTEGLLRFYYSSHLTFIYSLVFTVLQFTNYEWFKTFYQRKSGGKEFGIAPSLLGTFFSTSIAVLLSNPVDTLVIQHQMTNFATNENATTWSILKEEYRQRGLRIFTRHIGLRLMSLNAFGLATLPVYEFLRQRYGVDVEF